MSALAEVLAAHTADWTDWATSETDHEHYRCLCGLVEWHVNSSIDYHQAHAEHVADALTKAGYGKLPDAGTSGPGYDIFPYDPAPRASYPADDYECCASGSCEVCNPGAHRWNS